MEAPAQRPLGRSRLVIPPLVLGGMFRAPQARRSEIERALDFALDHGLHAIDTAPLYGFGEGERLLGAWLRGRRGRVTLLGKVGLRWQDARGDVLFQTTVDGVQRVVRRDSRPAAVRRDVEESLGRLGCEALDLVQIHQRDPHTPLAETLGELARLAEEGKLRAIGVSNFRAADLAEADRLLGARGLASTQEPYNLLERGIEAERLPCARERGIGVLAYSPLGRGLLAGRAAPGAPAITDGRRDEPLFQPRNRQRVQAAVESGLVPIARATGVSVGAVALAWVIARPGVTAAIVGAQDVAQVESALAAATLALDPAQQAALGQAFEGLRLDRHAGIPLTRRLVNRLRRIGQRLRRVRPRHTR